MSLILHIAWAFMRRRNSVWPTFSTWASILGVALGVTGFLVVVTIVNSVQKQFKEILLATNPHLAVYSVPNGIPDAAEEAKKMRGKIKAEVKNFGLFEYSEGIMSNGIRTATIVLRGLEGERAVNGANFAKLTTPFGSYGILNKPTDVNFTASNSEPIYNVVVGKGLAVRLNVGVNDKVNLTVGAYDGTQRAARLKIVGLLSIGLAGYDDRLAILNFSDSVNIFGRPGFARGIEFSFKDMDDAQEVAEQLKIQTSYVVRPWQEIDKGLINQINRDGVSIKIIVGIITLVAAFNILTTLSLNVMDRTRQIALLRSIGAPRLLIMKIFITMGLFLGVVGSVVGIGLGLIILKIFAGVDLGELKATYFLEKIPVFYDFSLMAQSMLVAMFLSFLSSIYPAYKAVKIAPLAGMQHGIN